VLTGGRFHPWEGGEVSPLAAWGKRLTQAGGPGGPVRGKGQRKPSPGRKGAAPERPENPARAPHPWLNKGRRCYFVSPGGRHLPPAAGRRKTSVPERAPPQGQRAWLRVIEVGGRDLLPWIGPRFLYLGGHVRPMGSVAAETGLDGSRGWRGGAGKGLPGTTSPGLLRRQGRPRSTTSRKVAAGLLVLRRGCPAAADLLAERAETPRRKITRPSRTETGPG